MHPTAYLDFALRTLHGAANTIPAAWGSFSQPAAALVLTAVWQGAAVALGLALCLRLAPRSPARHRFALWAAGFGVLVGLQLAPLISRLLPIHLRAIGGSAAQASMAAAASHPWLRLNPAWSLAIAALWLAAALFRAADLAAHSLHLRKLWKSAVPVEVDPASLPRSRGRVPRRVHQICTTSELERPSVIGFFAPRILIPDWLFSRLTPAELDQIVLHESEHLRRRDDWTNLLQKLCLVLFPLNPGLAWIERRMCREREMACDDGVIHITGAPRAYAACLANLAERGLQRRAGALSLGAWHARPELVRRVHSILRRKHALSPAAARAVVAAVGCILLAGAAALARCPRLIAFAPPPPAHNAPTEQAAVLAARRSSRGELAALKAPESNPAEELAASKGHDFRRAVYGSRKIPALAPGAIPSGASAHPGPRRASRAAAAASPAASQLQPAASPAAEDAALRSNAAQRPLPGATSAFTVLSAWESVALRNPQTGPRQAENKSAQRNQPVRVAGPRNALAVKRISPRITVTRMYLKIYSSGGDESTWLVIQL